MLERIISGGQTGVDQTAWRAARAFGIPTGGWMLLGFLTEKGPHPGLSECEGLTNGPGRELPAHRDHRVRRTASLPGEIYKPVLSGIGHRPCGPQSVTPGAGRATLLGWDPLIALEGPPTRRGAWEEPGRRSPADQGLLLRPPPSIVT
jgi:hypothetical protein